MATVYITISDNEDEIDIQMNMGEGIDPENPTPAQKIAVKMVQSVAGDAKPQPCFK